MASNFRSLLGQWGINAKDLAHTLGDQTHTSESPESPLIIHLVTWPRSSVQTETLNEQASFLRGSLHICVGSHDEKAAVLRFVARHTNATAYVQ